MGTLRCNLISLVNKCGSTHRMKSFISKNPGSIGKSSALIPRNARKTYGLAQIKNTKNETCENCKILASVL